MKNKLLVISILAILAFTGCGNKENDTVPVVSEAAEEIEEAETVDETEPVEEVETTEPIEVSNGEYNESGEDVEVEGEIVEGTALTQEEIDELKASAETDLAKKNIDRYEIIINGGTYTDGYGGVYDKVVGKPDNSWRRMTDAEAQAIIAQGEDAEGYYAAEAELEGTSWRYMDGKTGTIYYDYYAWEENAKANPIPKKEIKILTPETDPELYRALKGLD